MYNLRIVLHLTVDYFFCCYRGSAGSIANNNNHTCATLVLLVLLPFFTSQLGLLVGSLLTIALMIALMIAPMTKPILSHRFVIVRNLVLDASADRILRTICILTVTQYRASAIYIRFHHRCVRCRGNFTSAGRSDPGVGWVGPSLYSQAVGTSFFRSHVYFFPFSLLSSCLLLFLCRVSFLLSPFASVWENTCSCVPHYLLPYSMVHACFFGRQNSFCFFRSFAYHIKNILN